MEAITQKNMTGWDRLLRLAIVVVIAALYFTGILQGTWAIVLGVLAIVFLRTSAIGMRPLYALLGISTCRTAHPS